MKDCRTFLRLQEAFGSKQKEATNLGFAGAPGTLALNAPPPPPLPAHGATSNQQQLAANRNPSEGYQPSRGAINMIQKGRLSNRIQKLITRQVSLAIKSPPPTPEYLNWSDHKIEFSRDDHPPRVPRPGHAPLVLQAQIGGFDVGRVFMDAGSGINLIYASTLRAMNISLTNLAASDTCFHGIVPGKPNVPLGKITLDVVFGSRKNFRRENMEFEVMD